VEQSVAVLLVEGERINMATRPSYKEMYLKEKNLREKQEKLIPEFLLAYNKYIDLLLEELELAIGMVKK